MHYMHSASGFVCITEATGKCSPTSSHAVAGDAYFDIAHVPDCSSCPRTLCTIAQMPGLTVLCFECSPFVTILKAFEVWHSGLTLLVAEPRAPLCSAGSTCHMQRALLDGTTACRQAF